MSEKLSVEEILERIAKELALKDTSELNELAECSYTTEKTLEGKSKEVVEVVSHDIGGEGSAEDAPEFVLHYKPTDQYVGLGGWYASYHGTDWDKDFEEYEPAQITVYRQKHS